MCWLPPNVVWNVELHPSVRSRYVGSIESAEPSYYQMPLDDSYCNRPHIKKDECRRMWLIGEQMYRRNQAHSLQFRSEFDVADRSLELPSVFDKMTRKDNEPWVSGEGNPDACSGNAIRSVLEAPNAAEQKSTSKRTISDPGKPPQGILEAVWNAADLGDQDAQFDLGPLYAEGEGEPQDYVKAYFWFDIAASGKVSNLRRNEMVKSRDGSALRLSYYYGPKNELDNGLRIIPQNKVRRGCGFVGLALSPRSKRLRVKSKACLGDGPCSPVWPIRFSLVSCGMDIGSG